MTTTPATSTPSTTSARRGAGTRSALYAVLGTAAALVVTIPLLWAVLRAFQTNDTIVSAATWSQMLDLSGTNFAQILTPSGSLWRALMNSVIVSVATAVLTAVVSTLAGYGLSTFRFRGAGAALSVILLSMMVPFQAILTPLYLEMNAMHLTDSLLGLVLFSTTVNLPFGVFVMKAACDAVPASIEESALMDGAGTVRMLTTVLRPMLLPGVASAALYAFLASWTEFLGALTFITREDLYTLPVALLNLQSGTFGELDYGLLVAGAVVAMIPCILLYIALQRFYVQGLAAGAVKG